MAAGREELKAPWDRAAATYSEDFDVLLTHLLAPTLDAARIGPGARVLDVATGPGLLAAEAVKRGAEAVGTDFSDGMVEAARAHHPDIRFELADATAQPFEDGSFDAVVLGLVLFMLVEPVEALEEAHRVLAPGGRVACSLWRFPLVGHDLFYKRMTDYVKEDRVPGGPPLLGESDPEVLKGALIEAGFVSPDITELDVPWELETVDRMFTAFSAMRDLSTLSDAQMREFHAGVAADAEVYRDGELLRIPFPALILSGERPA